MTETVFEAITSAASALNLDLASSPCIVGLLSLLLSR